MNELKRDEDGTKPRFDQGVVAATCAAMEAAGMDVQPDIADNLYKRSSYSPEGDEIRVQRALFLGVAQATSEQMEGNIEDGASILDVTRAMVESITSSPDLHEVFCRYYKEAGKPVLFGTDSLAQALFLNTAQFDPDFIAANAKGNDLSGVLDYFNKSAPYKDCIIIPYDIQTSWSKMELTEALDSQPKLDYRKLADLEFAASEEGQLLSQAWSKAIGSIQFKQCKSTYAERVNPDGTRGHEPMIPLKENPVVEALFLDKLSSNNPELKYYLDSYGTVEFILNSDSARVHQAFVDALMTASRNSAKSNSVMSLLRHLECDVNPDHRELLVRDLMQITDALASQPYGEMMLEVITFGISSNDPKIRERYAELLIEGSISVERSKLLLLDSVDMMKPDSDPELIYGLAEDVYQHAPAAEKIKELAILKRNIAKEKESREVLLAFKAKSESSSHGKKTQGQTEAETDYYKLYAPIAELEKDFEARKNDFLLELLEGFESKGGGSNPHFQSILKRVILLTRTEARSGKTKKLPSEYQKLMSLAKQGGLSDKDIESIASHIGKSFEYLDENSVHLLDTVIRDIYDVALGDPDSVRIPTKETSGILYAASHLITKNDKFFQSLSQDELNVLIGTLRQYSESLERVKADVEGDAELTPDEKGLKLKNLKDVTRVLEGIHCDYAEHLKIESVKANPHIYYPWLLEKLVPFWREMDRRTGPRHSPSNEVIRLFNTIDSYIRSDVAQQDIYPEGFDVDKDGGLLDFLHGICEIILTPEGRYCGIIARNGMTFMHYATKYMPESVFRQLEAKYPDTKFARHVSAVRAPEDLR